MISHFGKGVCEKTGLEVKYLPLGLNTEFWTPGNKFESRENCRKFWLENIAVKYSDYCDIIDRVRDSKIVLTVADNYERKNLPACFEIVSKLQAMLVIVAPEREDRGWDLHELAKDFQISDRFVWVGSLTKSQLREHYRAADVLLLPSQAEGYGVPLREAAACGLPWVATDCTAISEATGGILIEPVRETIFPLGNQRRYWIDTKKAAEAVEGILSGESVVESPSTHSTWEECADVLLV